MWTQALDFIFPPLCVGCRAIGTWWCAPCEAMRQKNQSRTCVIEGATVYSAHSYDCPPVAHAVQALKFFRVAAVARCAAQWAAPFVPRSATLIPVPLHSRRERVRGFNQAHALCRAIADVVADVTVAPDALRRVRHTDAQVGSSAGERMQHMAGAFVVGTFFDQDAHYIIVDDVITTGSTLAACIQTIRAAGAARISCVTIAAA